MAAIARSATALADADSKLMLIYSGPRVHAQLEASEVIRGIGEANLFESEQWLGRTMIAAFEDASTWVDARSETSDDA